MLFLCYFFVELFAYEFYRDINRNPYHKIDENKDCGENKEEGKIKGNPVVYEIATNVGYVNQREVAECGFWDAETFDLIEYRGACLNEGKKICRQNSYKYLHACQGEVCD